MKNKILYCVAICSIFACSKSSHRHQFAVVENSNLNIQIRALELDSFKLPSIESSYIGLLSFKSDSIYLIDKKFCQVFIFDKHGSFVEKKLGQGQGPQEIATGGIDGYCMIDSSTHFFLGGENDCHLFNHDFYKERQFVIKKGQRHNNESYDDFAIYTVCYENLIIKNIGEYLYYNVFSEYNDMNFIDSPKEYFQEVHYLSKLNSNTGSVENVLGNYPDIYINDPGIKQYSFVNFDVDKKGKFYISFEADSLIYEYDHNFNPIYTYGYSGNNIQIKKKTLSTYDEFSKYYEICRKESGYYCGLKNIEETGLLFRNYKKNKSEYGLQIYKDRNLIGDVTVPGEFEILGYSSPYYYLNSATVL